MPTGIEKIVIADTEPTQLTGLILILAITIVAYCVISGIMDAKRMKKLEDKKKEIVERKYHAN